MLANMPSILPSGAVCTSQVRQHITVRQVLAIVQKQRQLMLIVRLLGSLWPISISSGSTTHTTGSTMACLVAGLLAVSSGFGLNSLFRDSKPASLGQAWQHPELCQKSMLLYFETSMAAACAVVCTAQPVL